MTYATVPGSLTSVPQTISKALLAKLFVGGANSAIYEHDDFVSGGENSSGAAAITTAHTFGVLGWRAAFSGANADVTLVTTNQDSTHRGVIQVATGTTNTGNAGICRFAAATPTITLGTGQAFVQEWLVRIPTLSDGTETYSFRCGWKNSVVAAPTDGAYFEYVSGTSANWRGVTMASSTPTVASGGTDTAVAAGVWIRLRMVWNGATVAFYVNSTLIGTSAANIPTASLAESADIIKSAGTTERLVLLDYFWQMLEWTSPRAP